MDPEATPATAEAPSEDAPTTQTPTTETHTATAGAAEPPPLPYSLRDRKKSIAFFWSLFILDCVAQPLALYFGLWYGTNLSHNLGMNVCLLHWCDFFVKNCRPLTLIAVFLSSLHHRHHHAGWYLRFRVFLPTLQPLPFRFKNPAVERKEIMGRWTPTRGQNKPE